jgi:hypothetical protein
MWKKSKKIENFPAQTCPWPKLDIFSPNLPMAHPIVVRHGYVKKFEFSKQIENFPAQTYLQRTYM